MPDSVESRDLLIRLDQKVSDGFAMMDKRFDAYDRRAEAFDQRITKIEAQLADRHLYIGQHNALITRVDTLETAHNRLDGMAMTMKFILGGGFATIVGTVVGFAKAFHAF